MNQRNLKNSEIDAVGKRLLTAVRLSADEIDRIVSAPRLFDSVRARIADGSEKTVRQSVRFNWIPAAAVMTALAVITVAVNFGIGNKSLISPATADIIPSAAVELKAENVEQALDTPAVVPLRARHTRPTSRTGVDKIKSKRYSRPRQDEAKPEGEFYALNLVGSLEDAATEGLIVRIDLPRSSLFAMGVNVSLENDTKFVKTDVLMGNDGVPRAIRFVE